MGKKIGVEEKTGNIRMPDDIMGSVERYLEYLQGFIDGVKKEHPEAWDLRFDCRFDCEYYHEGDTRYYIKFMRPETPTERKTRLEKNRKAREKRAQDAEVKRSNQEAKDRAEYKRLKDKYEGTEK